MKRKGFKFKKEVQDNMKKLLSLALATVMALGLVSCGNSSSGGNSAPSGSAASGSASGADWPTKSINIVVPWSAGGDTDFHARTLGQYLEKELGVSVTVVNTTGGGGSVASTEVKNSDPDGYTFLAFDTAMALNHASGITDFGGEAFDPVAIIGKSCGEFLVTQGDAPYDTIPELIECSEAPPGEVRMAANTGATSYYAAIKLSEQGADLNIVNSGSSSERVAALLGDQINLSVNAYGVIGQYIETGDLKILGCLATERSETYAAVPTAVDQGVDLSYDLIYNLLAPKGTDPAIIEKMSEACQKIIEEDSSYAEAIATSYGEKPFYMNSSEAVDFLKGEDDMYMEYADLFQAKS